MNRGSAIKWIEQLKNAYGKVKYDPCQLGFIVGEEIHMSPSGVLANFLTVSEIAWDGVSLIFDGEQFSLSENLRKRCKFKNHPYEKIDFGDNYGKQSLSDIECKIENFLAFAEFVEQNYELL